MRCYAKRQCRFCKRLFAPYRDNAYLCSSACRTAYWNYQQPRKQFKKRRCTTCGRWFRPDRESAKFCSRKCKYAAYRTITVQDKKQRAVEYKGGKCIRCGYSRCMAALEFHHRARRYKRVGHAVTCMGWKRLKCDLDKCDLLCANCHRELHSQENIMPVKRIVVDGKPAYQWGNTGAKYVYVPGNKASREAAKKKAIQQGLAVARRMGVKPEL